LQTSKLKQLAAKTKVNSRKCPSTCRSGHFDNDGVSQEGFVSGQRLQACRIEHVYRLAFWRLGLTSVWISISQMYNRPVMRPFLKIACELNYAATLLLLCVALQSIAYAADQKAPQRPRIFGIDHVTVYVSDMKKSSEFYSNVLGLTNRCEQYKDPRPCYR